MKAIRYIPIVFLFFFGSCFLDATSSGRLSFLLSRLNDPEITRLHVAVYEGAPQGATLLAYSVFEPNSVIDMTVPTGDDRVIVIWAESTPGNAKYYGASNPIRIDSMGTEDVDMELYRFNDPDGEPLGFDPVFALNRTQPQQRTEFLYSWNAIYGADAYELQLLDTSGQVAVWQTVYTGADNEFQSSVGEPSKVRALSSLFQLVTEFSPQYPVP